jgi:hypothetical protein
MQLRYPITLVCVSSSHGGPACFNVRKFNFLTETKRAATWSRGADSSKGVPGHNNEGPITAPVQNSRLKVLKQPLGRHEGPGEAWVCCTLFMQRAPGAHHQLPVTRAPARSTSKRSSLHQKQAPVSAHKILRCRPSFFLLAGERHEWTLAARTKQTAPPDYKIVGPEQRAVRQAPARPPQGAVQAVCGACEGLAGDASRSRRCLHGPLRWPSRSLPHSALLLGPDRSLPHSALLLGPDTLPSPPLPSPNLPSPNLPSPNLPSPNLP